MLETPIQQKAKQDIAIIISSAAQYIRSPQAFDEYMTEIAARLVSANIANAWTVNPASLEAWSQEFALRVKKVTEQFFFEMHFKKVDLEVGILARSMVEKPMASDKLVTPNG